MDKLQGDTKFKSKVMGCLVHAIEKAIRPTGSHIPTDIQYTSHHLILPSDMTLCFGIKCPL